MTDLVGPLAALAFLLGEHEGEEDVHATQWTDATTATASTTGRATAAGRALVQDYVQTGPGGTVLFTAHSVVMADPGSDQLLLWGFDSAGYPPEPSRGRFEHATLDLSRTSPRGEARIVITDEGDGAWTQTRFFRPPGGDRQVVLTGRMRRSRGPRRSG